MSDLTDFLLARVAEDEAVARAATPGPWVHGDRWLVAGVQKADHCTYCDRAGEPTWKGVRSINGQRMPAHVHRAPDPWPHGIYSETEPSGSVVVVNDTDEYGYMLNADADHIARHDPARVLAECEAKRRIVALGPSECGDYADQEAFGSHYPDRPSYPCDGCSAAESSDAVWLASLRALALPYADHPDFRPEWRP